MSDSWEKKRKALEDGYFHKQNELALKRIKERADQNAERLSPITGKPMVQETYMGVAIDRCEKSGGIWLDNGELEEILTAINSQEKEDKSSLLEDFFSFLNGKK